MTRSETVQALAAEPLDLLVAGGGIVGSGVLRDAAMRGLRAGLVEQNDFASGTSSRSSQLLHGGLRYLEQGRIGLVRQASIEKMRLHRIAPHLAEPRAFIFPAYRQGSRPLWQLALGVKLYDWLSGGRNLQPSRRLSRAATAALAPALRTDGLRGAVCYYDAFTNDARLVTDTLTSAAEHGGLAVNYLRLRGVHRDGRHWAAELEDGLNGRQQVVRARAVVNACGPWSEQLPGSGLKLRLSKGVHIVIDRARLPGPDAVVITEGQRLLFVLPWGERIIVGTTDTDYAGAPEAVQVLAEDVTYLLHALRRFFPGVALSEADIVSSWAGVRPLLAHASGTPSDISRAHRIDEPQPGWWDLAGGKLTTYRLMAEQVVDRVCAYLELKHAPCRTAEEPLLPAGAATFSGVVPPAFGEAAVRHFVEKEWAIHLEDVMVRRGGWQHYHRNAGQLAGQAALWMAAVRGWSPAEREAELAEYHQATARRWSLGEPR